MNVTFPNRFDSCLLLVSFSRRLVNFFWSVGMFVNTNVFWWGANVFWTAEFLPAGLHFSLIERRTIRFRWTVFRYTNPVKMMAAARRIDHIFDSNQRISGRRVQWRALVRGDAFAQLMETAIDVVEL